MSAFADVLETDCTGDVGAAVCLVIASFYSSWSTHVHLYPAGYLVELRVFHSGMYYAVNNTVTGLTVLVHCDVTQTYNGRNAANIT